MKITPRLRVLFVDDEEEILNGVRLTLRKERKHWEMLFAQSGEEALEILANEPIDVVCTDIQMPGIDGSELLARILDSHPSVCRIAISGHADDEVALRAISVAHRFLAKPAGREDIVNAIQEAHTALAQISSPELRTLVTATSYLPPLPQLFSALAELLRDDQCDVDDVTRIVRLDPALSAKLLQFANSAYFSGTRNIACVANAGASLGPDTIRAIALHAGSFGGDENTGAPLCPRLESRQLRAALTSRVATHIAKEMQLDAEIALTAGLLADIGLLLLEARAPELAAEAETKALAEDLPLIAAQELIMGTNHAQIGAALLGSWGLPQSIVEAVRLQHTPRIPNSDEFDVIGALHIARYLAQQYLDEIVTNQDFPPRHLDFGYVNATGISAKIQEWAESTRHIAEQILDESDTKAA